MKFVLKGFLALALITLLPPFAVAQTQSKMVIGVGRGSFPPWMNIPDDGFYSSIKKLADIDAEKQCGCSATRIGDYAKREGFLHGLVQVEVSAEYSCSAFANGDGFLNTIRMLDASPTEPCEV